MKSNYVIFFWCDLCLLWSHSQPLTLPPHSSQGLIRRQKPHQKSLTETQWPLKPTDSEQGRKFQNMEASLPPNLRFSPPRRCGCHRSPLLAGDTMEQLGDMSHSSPPGGERETGWRPQTSAGPQDSLTTAQDSWSAFVRTLLAWEGIQHQKHWEGARQVKRKTRKTERNRICELMSTAAKRTVSTPVFCCLWFEIFFF